MIESRQNIDVLYFIVLDKVLLYADVETSNEVWHGTG